MIRLYLSFEVQICVSGFIRLLSEALTSGLTMYGFSSGSEHHVSLGCEVVLLQLLHQVSDHTGALGFTCTADSNVTVQPAVPGLVL